MNRHRAAQAVVAAYYAVSIAGDGNSALSDALFAGRTLVSSPAEGGPPHGVFPEGVTAARAGMAAERLRDGIAGTDAERLLSASVLCLEGIGFDASRERLLVASSQGLVGAAAGDGRGIRGGAFLLPWMLHEALAEFHGGGRPAESFCNGCVAGASALECAVDMVRAGAVSSVVVLAAEGVSDFYLRGFEALGALSSAAARPFDRRRDGLNLSEGVYAVRIAAAGSASRGVPRSTPLLSAVRVSCDAFHLSAPARGGAEACRAMVEALESASTKPSEVDAVFVHANGSVYTDLMLAEVLCEVFAGPGGDGPLVTSTAGVLGHPVGAVSVQELVCACIAMEAGAVFPCCGLVEPEVEGLRYVIGEPVERGLERVMVISTGFGGLNGVFLLECGGSGG